MSFADLIETVLGVFEKGNTTLKLQQGIARTP